MLRTAVPGRARGPERRRLLSRAAALLPGSELTLPGVGLNPKRSVLDYLLSAGLGRDLDHVNESSGEVRAT